jgi:gliding motility-associated-like protein
VACHGASTGSATVQATGGAGPYTFTWSPGALQGPQQSGLVAGNYTVTATDAEGCTGSFQVLITQPPPLSATITGTTPTTCGGADGTATVQASGGTAPYTQLWSPAGGTALTATGLAEGSYQVTITDANGCTASASTTIQPVPTQAEISGPDALCTGAPVVLTASGGTAYLWSTGATTPSITVTAGGTYTVEVSGCGTDNASITVVETTVVADIGGDPLVGDPPLEVLFTNTSTPPDAAFQWDLGDGTAFTGATTDHVYTDPGIYTVVMTATANGCSDSDTLLVVVNSPVVVSDIFVPNVFSPNGDGQNDTWGVRSVGLSSLDAQIFNRWGQQVAQLRAPDQSWDGRTDAGELTPSGTYYFVLEAQGGDGRSYRFTGSLTLLR